MQRLLIAIYAIWTCFCNKLSPKSSSNKVLIIFQQIIGDSVLFLNPLVAYTSFYSKQGKDLTILCRPIIKKFWDSTADLPKDLNVEVIDFTRLFNDFRYFKEIVKQYRHYADTIIAPGSTLSSDLLSTVLCARHKIGMIGHKKTNWPFHIALFQKLAFTEIVMPEKEMMMIQRHRLLLNYLGCKDYQGKISKLKVFPSIVSGYYCVICPGSSLQVKCWPVERYAEICDWLIGTYGIDVYLCGGKEEKKVAVQMMSLIKFRSKVINRVGDTTFEEWISLIQHSLIVLGNDSGSLHIAAASNKKSVCVAGVYDKYQFFPYKVDALDDGQVLPSTLYVDMNCEYCKSRGYFHGYGNKECQHEIGKGNCALCVSAISVNSVKKVIKNMLS